VEEGATRTEKALARAMGEKFCVMVCSPGCG